MKEKIYLANSVWLPWAPLEHTGGNNNRQFTILIRAKTKKRVSEVTKMSPYSLNWCGLHEAPAQFGFKGEWVPEEIVKQSETIYYLVEHTKTGYLGKWFEYPKTKADSGS